MRFRPARPRVRRWKLASPTSVKAAPNVPAKTAAAAEKAGKEPQGSEEITLTTRKAPSEDPANPSQDRAIVGIQAGTDHTFPFEVDIKTRRQGCGS